MTQQVKDKQSTGLEANEKDKIIKDLTLNRHRNPNDPYLIELKMTARKAGLTY